jgi:GNAT superfamily N-acetyltransferase
MLRYMSTPINYSNYTIRDATPSDAPALLDLIDALADYEKLDRPTTEARERLAHDGFTLSPPRFETFLAFVEGQESPTGYAIFFFTYSTFLAKPTLYLEDFFVLPECRGVGIGAALFDRVRQEARKRECGRMEWSCLNWNQLGIDFYEKRGAVHLDEWRVYRFTTETL